MMSNGSLSGSKTHLATIWLLPQLMPNAVPLIESTDFNSVLCVLFGVAQVWWNLDGV